jgi:glycosyltransferase involved in cell wall biosynthesis
MDPLINIITRTSNRPNGFDRNYCSIKNQTYKNINHIVIYDNHSDFEKYLFKYDNITTKWVDRDKLKTNYMGPHFLGKFFWPSYHNLYFNPILKTIDEGWIIFLDDDDYLFDKDSVQKIVNHLQDEDTLYIWKMLSNGNIIIPKEIAFKMKKIELGNIGNNCFTFHSKWSKETQWDAFKCADFRFVKTLSEKIPKQEWIDEILMVVPSSGFGKRIDK